jgi:hypothetical protein
MYLLTKLIKLNYTVVYESLTRKGFWVFKENGSYFNEGEANVINCVELEDQNTIHLFDSKAGPNAYEPAMTGAKLVYIMSTNKDIGKQTKRRPKSLEFIFPSTTEEEYFMYAQEFNISVDEAEELALKAGYGKIRTLRTINKNYIDNAIEQTTADMITLNNFKPNSSITPALWLDGNIQKIDNDKIKNLTDQYLYSNSQWNFASRYVSIALSSKFPDQFYTLFANILTSINNFDFNRTFGSLTGSIAEILYPKFIADEGFICNSFDNSSTIKFPKLKIQYLEVQKVESLLENWTDPTVLYVIVRNMPGFDCFNPPNNFFQITNTLRKNKPGNHYILYSTFAILNKCLKSKNLDVNHILVVEENQRENWKSELPFKIDSKAIIESNEPIKINGKSEKTLQQGQQSQYKNLPTNYKEGLSRVKQYIGLVTVKRKFSTIKLLSNFAIKLIK